MPCGFGRANADWAGCWCSKGIGRASSKSIKAGKLKAPRVTTARRSPTLPDVPTVAEQRIPAKRYLTAEVANWGKLVKDAGVKPE